jgi:hypothetical protein
MLRFCLAALVLAACAPPGEPQDSMRPVDGVAGEVVGVVRIVGSAPVNIQVVLDPEQGSPIRIAGPLRAELEQLGGVDVALRGRVVDSPGPLADRQIEVAGYRIVGVDGRPVVMGEIVSISNGTARLRTPDGDEVYLSGVPAAFREGQKVWVQGPRSVAVQAYGLIRR